MEEKQPSKKTGRIAISVVANVLLYTVIAVCLLGVLLTIIGQRDADGTVTLFGTQMRVVQSPSMERSEATDVSGFEIEDIPTGSMVFIETVPSDATEAARWYADLRVGDVLTFKYTYVRQETITHRIIAIEEKPTGGYLITLAGDNRSDGASVSLQTIDTAQENSFNYVIGKVTGQSYALGLFTRALRSPIGLICMIIIPSLVIAIFEVIKITRVLGADKKKKMKDEQESREKELDALKKRIAELEARESADAPPAAKSKEKSEDDGETP